MRSKKIGIVLAAVLVAVIVAMLAWNGSDQDIAGELARKQQRVVASAESIDPAEPVEPLSTFQLTPRVLAEHDESSDTWFVTARQSRAFIKLPFTPPESGSRIGASSGEDSDSKAQSSYTANPGFLGADACRDCHEEKHAGFVMTAHHNTSGLMGRGQVHGHFSGASSVMPSRDDALSFRMFQEGDRYLQQVDLADYHLQFPMDIFTGSSKAGQTFLYWHEDKLYQAFVSYLTELDEWIPSPGYTDTTVDFSRQIRTMCLECHMTYIDQRRVTNVYKPDTAVWGISCERCHGPGREHVAYHRAHPDDRVARHIVEPSDLPRERQLDICSQCHSGDDSLMTGTFDFRPGMEVKLRRSAESGAKGVGGIHTANQLDRLSMSECFQKSEMTCTSCHNPHLNQRGKKVEFTASCLICHQPDHCGMAEELGPRVADNCVECHMPMGDNENMTLQVSGGSFTVQMIDHYIRVDQQATKNFLSR